MRNYVLSMKMTYETGINAIDKVAKFTEGSLNVLYGENLNIVREEAIKIAKGIKKNFKDNYSSSTYIPIVVRGFKRPETTELNITYRTVDPVYDKNITNLVRDVVDLKNDPMRSTYKTGLRMMELKTGKQEDIIKQAPAILIIDDIEYLFGNNNEMPDKMFENLKELIKDSGIILIGTSNRSTDQKNTVQDSYTSMIRKLIDVKLCIDGDPEIITCYHNTSDFNKSLDFVTKMQMYK